MFLFTLLACSTLLPFNIHNRNISTDRKKDGVVYEVCQLWLRRIHCLNRIFTFHLLSTKASVPLKIGRSRANAAFGTGRNYRKFEFPTCKICSPDQFSRISQSECRRRDTTSDLHV